MAGSVDSSAFILGIGADVDQLAFPHVLPKFIGFEMDDFRIVDVFPAGEQQPDEQPQRDRPHPSPNVRFQKHLDHSRFKIAIPNYSGYDFYCQLPVFVI
jgi:hypothetical protein